MLYCKTLWHRSVVADWKFCTVNLLVQRRVVKRQDPELLGLAQKKKWRDKRNWWTVRQSKVTGWTGWTGWTRGEKRKVGHKCGLGVPVLTVWEGDENRDSRQVDIDNIDS